MSAFADISPTEQVQRLEELGRIILAYSDVTDKLQKSQEQLAAKVAELQQELGEKNKLLERKERLAALGEMAAGMAHEIRNPLGGIQLYASLLASDVAAMPQSLTLVNKISGGVRRLEGLVSQALHFTREISVCREDADVSMIVEGALELAQPRILERKIDVRVSGLRPLVANVDEHLLGQSLLNLILNAVDAMEMGGTLDVQSCRATAADGDGRQVKLLIRDSGPGDSTDDSGSDFQPVFHDEGHRYGLGTGDRASDCGCARWVDHRDQSTGRRGAV